MENILENPGQTVDKILRKEYTIIEHLKKYSNKRRERRCFPPQNDCGAALSGEKIGGDRRNSCLIERTDRPLRKESPFQGRSKCVHPEFESMFKK